MEHKLRLAALSKLLDAKSEAIDARLHEEFGRVEKALATSSEYDELSQVLETLAVLAPRFHMAVLPAVESFVRSVSSRTLTDSGSPIDSTMLRYRSADTLIDEAIEVATQVRYLHTEHFTDLMLELSHFDMKQVRRKAQQALESVARFDLDIFYKREQGAQPQSRLVAHLLGLSDTQLVINARTILPILDVVLSPSMQGEAWTYKSLTIKRGSIVSGGGVAEVRASVIALLKRMYSLEESVEFRKAVLQTLDAATRREHESSDAETAAMFERDAIWVLEFMRDLVATEPLPIVQAIEHKAYWDYYHALTPNVESKALAVRDALAIHSEYQIYKQLIGFEGIFGNWEELRRTEAAWEYGDTKRRAAARRYLEEINDETVERWRDRILEFSRTQSRDLAAFPVYYDFLDSIGRERPRLALELVTAHTETMSPFLVALLRGLWSSERSTEIESLTARWIADGVHLAAIAKSVYNSGSAHIDKLRAIVARAVALDDRNAILEVMGVAASLHAEGIDPAKSVFLDALRALARSDDPRWASAVWFNRDFRLLVGRMTPGERAEVLTSLASLSEIDYQAEEVISAVAEQDVESAIAFFMNRLRRSRELSTHNAPDSSRFEAVPYQLHKLNEQLAKAPDELLLALRRDFDDETRGMFTYRGARLLRATFSDFGEPLKGLLLRFVERGDDGDIDFVLSSLRAYDGSSAVMDVCKAIVKAVPMNSSLWNEIAAAIESTGVVVGEYGMANAFEHKREEIAAWRDDDDLRVRTFAEWLTESLDRLVAREKQRADESVALRKYRFGEGKEES